MIMDNNLPFRGILKPSEVKITNLNLTKSGLSVNYGLNGFIKSTRESMSMKLFCDLPVSQVDEIARGNSSADVGANLMADVRVAVDHLGTMVRFRIFFAGL
jgi:hypothetical protein